MDTGDLPASLYRESGVVSGESWQSAGEIVIIVIGHRRYCQSVLWPTKVCEAELLLAAPSTCITMRKFSLMIFEIICSKNEGNPNNSSLDPLVPASQILFHKDPRSLCTLTI